MTDHRSLRRALTGFLFVLGLPVPLAIAQTAPAPAKPAFNTTAPSYDPNAGGENAAKAVAAEVEGRPITMGDVGDAIAALPSGLSRLPFDTLYPSVLDQLIKQQALGIRARQQGLDEDPAVRRKMRAAADRELAEAYMRQEISRGITEEALLDRYNRDIAGKPGPDEVRVRVILTDSETSAADLLAQLRSGADFAAVARRASKDVTAEAGGDLGFNARDRMTPEVGTAAFTTPPGQLVPGPVHGAAGWFVVKVEERRQAPTPAFAAAREQLRQTMLLEGVAPLAAAALKDLRVRKYNFMGDEIDAGNPGTK